MKNEYYRNAEWYWDPTPGTVIEKMMREYYAEKRKMKEKKWRPLVYICSPYAGDFEANKQAARRYCRFAVESGYIPIASHLLYPQFLDDDDPDERNLGIFFGNVLMDKCEELWIFGGKLSPGMRAELNRAKRKGRRVRRFTEDCKEVKVT